MPIGHRREDEYIPIKIEGWNGKFVRNDKPSDGIPCSRREACSYNRSHSDANQFYAHSTSPTILPPEWSGTFVNDPNDVRIKPERNRSDDFDYFGYTNEPEILPTQWSGKFELDPNDVRIKPERNFSDARNYVENNRVINRYNGNHNQN